MNGRRVVVVDDNASMRTLLAMHLAVEGWDVIGEAADADEGLSTIRELIPDAVLLDVELPNGPGTRLLPEIRGHCPGTRIVLISADPMHDAMASQLGADGFFLKGDPLSQLLDLLSTE